MLVRALVTARTQMLEIQTQMSNQIRRLTKTFELRRGTVCGLERLN